MLIRILPKSVAMNAKSPARAERRPRANSVQTTAERGCKSVDFLSKAYALDRAGREKEAIPLYEAALRGRLTKDKRIDAMICLASSYRIVGNVDASLRWLETCVRAAPKDAAVRLFQALAYVDRGDALRGLSVLASALLDGTDTRRVAPYRPALARYFRRILRTAKR